MTPNPISLELRRVAERLRELFPEAKSVQLSSRGNEIDVEVHRIGDADGMEMLRRIGLGDITSTPAPHPHIASWVEAKAEGVQFCVYVRQEAVAL